MQADKRIPVRARRTSSRPDRHPAFVVPGRDLSLFRFGGNRPAGPAGRPDVAERILPGRGLPKIEAEIQWRRVHCGSVACQSASQAASRRRPSARWASRPTAPSSKPSATGANMAAMTAWATTCER